MCACSPASSSSVFLEPLLAAVGSPSFGCFADLGWFVATSLPPGWLSSAGLNSVAFKPDHLGSSSFEPAKPSAEACTDSSSYFASLVGAAGCFQSCHQSIGGAAASENANQKDWLSFAAAKSS